MDTWVVTHGEPHGEPHWRNVLVDSAALRLVDARHWDLEDVGHYVARFS